MPPVFLDTGAIYAFADPDDSDHAAVRTILAAPERTFILHELILVESFSLLTKRLHKQAALETIGAFRVSPRVEKVPLTTGLLRRRLETLLEIQGQKLGLGRLRQLRIDGAPKVI